MEYINELLKRYKPGRGYSSITKTTIINKLKIIQRLHEITIKELEDKNKKCISELLKEIQDKEEYSIDIAQEAELYKKVFDKLATDFIKMKYNVL